MDLLKKIILLLILTFSYSGLVLAECDDKTISNLKLQSKNIEVNYEYNEDLYSDDFDLKIANRFNVYISGINDKLYINDVTNQRLYLYSDVVDGLIKIENIGGGSSLKFEIFSKECDEKLRTVNLKLPYYNSFSENELCLQYSDAAVCNKFLDYELTQEKFDAEINKYINSNKNEEEKGENLFSNFVDLIKNNYVYIIVTIIIIVIISTIIIINKKRRELS